MLDPVFTVCGAGRAGAALAADMALMGFDVNLFELDDFRANITPIMEKGGVELSGKTQSGKIGFAKLHIITTDPEKAFKDADLIMITSPAFGHEAFFKAIFPYLRMEQIVMINTGYWASLRLASFLKEKGAFEKITLAEASIMPYLSEKDGNKVHIFNVKQDIKLATFPGNRASKIFDIIKLVYPQHKRVPNVLWTNFAPGNNGAHAPLLLPIAGIPFDRYRGCKLYGEATLCGAKLVEAFDKERIKIAKTLGCDVETTFEWFQKAYGYKGSDIAEALRKSPHADRYIPAERLKGVAMEDLAYFYVPSSRIADSLGVATPLIKGIIEVMGVMLDANYWEKGITLEQLGFAGLTAEQIVKYANTGQK
jgi:opine dehydrogenase